MFLGNIIQINNIMNIASIEFNILNYRLEP